MHQYVQKLSELAVSADAIENGMCFMCGEMPSTGIGEHVFPLWLQHRYGLLDQKLTLLNGTLIPYRRLTSPCCVSCNTGPLSRLENRVKQISKEPDIDNQDFKILLGQWLFKILFGVIHAECRMSRSRRDPSLGKIFPSEFVDELYSLHLLINSCRKLTVFKCLHGPLPFTIYLYRIVESRHYGPFDFTTNLIGKSVAIRMGKFGAIAVADGGLQFEAGECGPFELSGQELHPLQFAEIAARVHYKASLRDATHSFIKSETPELLHIEQSGVVSFSNNVLNDGSIQIFRNWDEGEFYYMLPRYTRINAQSYDESVKQNFTLLFLPDGSFNKSFSRLDELLDLDAGMRHT